MLVLDASIALAWIFERTKPSEAVTADRVLSVLTSESAIVPALWYTEVVNGLLVAERRNVISLAEAADFLTRLSRLPIRTDPVPVDCARVRALHLSMRS